MQIDHDLRRAQQVARRIRERREALEVWLRARERKGSSPRPEYR